MSFSVKRLVNFKATINTGSFKVNSSNANWIAIISSFYLFISTNPYILWTIPSSIVFLLVLTALFILSFIQYYNKKTNQSVRRVVLAILFFALSLYMAIPLFWHGHHMFKILQFGPLLLIVFLPNSVLYRTFKYFRSLIVFFAFISIALYFFLLFNINLPHYVVDGFTIPMQYKNDFYRVYYLAVSSTNTVYSVGGLTIARACGPFLEPGHFAIYLGIVLAIEKLIWNKLSKVLIIAGFLTFSPAFIIILLIIVLYDLFVKKNTKALFLIISGVAIIFTFLLTNSTLREAIIFLAWNRNFAEGRSIIDDRARDYTIYAYNDFIKTTSVLTGKGADYLDKIGVLSDPRGMVFKYGLIGTGITIVILTLILSLTNKKILFVLFPIVLLIYSHRSWMFESPYIYLLLFLGVSSGIYINQIKTPQINKVLTS